MDMASVRSEIFAENQAKLPEDQRCGPLDGEVAWCMIKNEDGYGCTRAKGHDGDHAACGVLGQLLAVWS